MDRLKLFNFKELKDYMCDSIFMKKKITHLQIYMKQK